jgi:heat shock protein HslJ
MELSGDHMLKFSPAAVTRMACPGENVEAPFLQMLEQATHWSINGKVLSLYNGSNVLGKFSAVDVSGAVPAELTGTWELEYITGPRIAFEGLYPEKKPTLIIDGSLDYKGNTSCNGMGGKFTVKANSIKFNSPITTMMACPGAGEQTFLKTLDMIDGWAVDGGKLVLKGKGVDMMRFVKK